MLEFSLTVLVVLHQFGESVAITARWSLLDVVQSVSQTKSDCFSAFLIDSVIFYLFLM